MLTTKSGVDKFVQKYHQNFNTEKEKNQHGYRIAKMYYNCGEYELARRYVSNYLTVVPDASLGHRLLGECLEKLNRRQDAFKSYRTSIELDPKQKDLLLKVCELMVSEDVFDQLLAQYWCEQAQEHYPNHPILFMLRERIATSKTTSADGNNEVEKLILSELEHSPSDVGLRVRLLQHLLRTNKIKEAFKHAFDLEQINHNIFSENLVWYETVADILIRYQQENKNTDALTTDFWIYLTAVTDKIACLRLDEQSAKSISDCTSAVFNFDQTLCLTVEKLKKHSDKKFIHELTTHYHGQLCMNFATLNFKKAKIDKVSFKEASRLNIPLLLGAWSSPPAELSSGWLIQSSETTKKWIQRWNIEANYRNSQAGHILLSVLGEKRINFSSKLEQICSANWRERVYKMLFVNRDHLSKIKSSYFMVCPQLSELRAQIPASVELIAYDEIAQFLNPSSLHHIIWFALNSPGGLHEFKCKIFSGLQYSTTHLSNCSADSLNVLDIQAFIYCAAACARVIYQDSRHSENKSPLLPVSITERVCTEIQESWFRAAYKLYNKFSDSDLGGTRLMLTQGIEVIRCVGNHGLNVNLLVLLAKTFSQHEKSITDPTKKEQVGARAVLYWNNAIPLLERQKNNQKIIYSINKKSYFEYREKEFTLAQINQHLEDGKLYLACKFKEQREYDRALELLAELRSPYASYYQAKIYQLLGEEQLLQHRENVTSEMRSKNVIMLARARDCYYYTLDRLKEPFIDKKHPLNQTLGTEIEHIESMLSRIDPDTCTGHINDIENISDENISSVGSMGDHIQMMSAFGNGSATNFSSSKHNRTRNIHSTPMRNNSLHVDLESSMRRTEARPSPERLEAQIRQISLTKDTVVTHILEQNRIMLDSYRSLSDEIRHLKEELKNFMDSQKIQEDLNAIKGMMTDQIPMLKKEIADLRKETAKLKSAQLNDEDLYRALNEDFEYNIHSAAAANAFNQSPLYPSFPTAGRPVTATPSLNYSAALYPSLYPPALYGYHPAMAATGLPPTAPTAVPSFADSSPQITDFRNLGQPLITNTSHLPPVVPPTVLSSLSHITASSTSNNVLINKTPPVNVVITASDPVPTAVTTSQPVLSVTIPPQHLKGLTLSSKTSTTTQPHSYQIPLPAVTSSPFTSSSLNATTTPFTITTQNLLANIAPPIYSSISEQKTPPKQNLFAVTSENLQKTLFSTNNVTPSVTVTPTTPSITNNTIDLNKTNTSTSSADVEYDPCPDFKPIIPLPAEVEVKTGEEGEEVLYKERAKLFRYVDKIWKERGAGDIKILYNKTTGKVRILMRRDQVHKICANHFLAPDMELKTMDNNDRALIWVANDFADEEVRLETLCIRFKTSEQANTFRTEFENAKKLLSINKSILNEEKSTPLTKKDEPKTVEKVETLTSSPFTFKATATSSPSTNIFGGFKFSTKPMFDVKIDDPKETKLDDDNQKKSNPFAGFSFIKSPTSISSTSVSTVDQISTLKTDESKSKIKDSSLPEDFIPTVEFNPVVPLPDLVETQTGEEDETVEFCQRAKLLRFDSTSKEWKERGVGEMKILVSGMVRLLMRREQVLKVCCNHQVTKTMSFAKMPKNDNAVSWAAQDYSENELKSEMFAIRFNKVEIADQFLETLNRLQSQMSDDNFLEELDVSSDTENVEAESRSELAATAPTVLGWGDKFKPKEGSWQCPDCYLSNNALALRCLACEKTKPGTEVAKTTTHTTPTTTSTTSNSSWGSLFKPKAGSWECKSCFVNNDASKIYCIACESPKDDTVPKQNKGINLIPEPDAPKFTFGIQPSTTTVAAPNAPVTNIFGNTKPQPSGFVFGATTLPVAISTPTVMTPENKIIDFGSKTTFGFQFNKPNLTPSFGTLKQSTPTQKSTYTFGSPDKFEFGFTPRSPRKSGGEESDGNDNTLEDEGEHIYFAPVVPLPDKIVVKTGEEDEDTVYCHRAKLFRFVDGEWKERGIGDLKILRHKINGKLRVVMRRDQILKICLNHALTKNMEYFVKDDKSWLFTAADFSEGEVVHQQFCVRFKTPEIAKEFMKIVQNEQTKLIEGSESIDVPQDDDDEDVILVSPIISTELEKKATDLKLPPNFYSYLTKPPCAGCIGCDPDAYNFESNNETLVKNKPNETPIKSTNFSFTNALKSSQVTDTNKIKSIFGGSDDKNENSSPQSQQLFGISNTQSIFSKPITADSTTTQTKSIFGGVGNSNTGLFGSANFSFGSKTVVTSNISSSVPSTTITPVNTSPGLLKQSFLNVKPTTQTFSFTSTTKSTENSENKFSFGENLFSTPPAVTQTSSTNIFSLPKPEIKIPEAPVLKTDSLMDFAALANKGENVDFLKPSSNKTFQFEGAGTPVFASLIKPQSKTDETTQKDKTNTSDADISTTDEYDPHYEPIIPLPAEVEIKTGEEDEQKLFCERAKLFRYDPQTKEWKERGIGEMKILYHCERQTYRFILRREQVHKLVLNQLLWADMELNQLSSSTNAFCWAGMNYAEDSANGVSEKLAIRFKNEQLAKQFYYTVKKCQEELRNIQVQVPLTVEEKETIEPESTYDEDDEEAGDDGEEYDEEEYDDEEEEEEEYNGEEYNAEDDNIEEYNAEDDNIEEEERNILWEQLCTVNEKLDNGELVELVVGDVQIVYDNQTFCSKILVLSDDGEVLSNIPIHPETAIQIENDTCTWTGLDEMIEPIRKRTLCVEFESSIIAEGFCTSFSDALEMAVSA